VHHTILCEQTYSTTFFKHTVEYELALNLHTTDGNQINRLIHRVGMETPDFDANVQI